MSDWKPAPVPGLDIRGLALTPEEGFVLSRLDGQTSLKDLGAMTQLSDERLRQVLAHLVETGAVAPGVPVTPAVSSPQTAGLVPPPVANASSEDAPAVDAAALEEEAAPDAEPETAEAQTTHRALYEARFRSLPPEARAAAAQEAVDPELSALCFDATAEVARAVLANPKVGLPHARLLARHHPTTVGLEALVSRSAFLADPQVRQRLLANAHLSEGLFQRTMAGRPLSAVLKIAQSHDVTEQSKRAARNLLRSRFTASSAEERVSLIFATEGRVLALLQGVPLDGKAVALVCAKPCASAMLVQSFARWGATPPAILAHLLKQPLVQRQQALRRMVLAHPNTPSNLRRGDG
jgi:hypothetical protein